MTILDGSQKAAMHPNESPPSHDGNICGHRESSDDTRVEEVPEFDDVAEFDGTFAATARPKDKRPYPWYQDREYLTGGWVDRAIWKAAFVEAMGTAGYVYTSGQVAATLHGYNTLQTGAYIGISNILLLSTFIYATAAITGGHLNQLVTFSAIFAGICPFSRGTLYLCGQTLGAALGGGILSGVWGHARSKQLHGGGCFYDPSEMSTAQVFLNEIFASFVYLFLVYGVGLDPRQTALVGARLGPLLVGVSLGILTFATSGVAPGYSGAGMNPGRCLAFGIVDRNLSTQWVWWFGPAIAALLLAFSYNMVPPHLIMTDEEAEKDIHSNTSSNRQGTAASHV